MVADVREKVKSADAMVGTAFKIKGKAVTVATIDIDCLYKYYIHGIPITLM